MTDLLDQTRRAIAERQKALEPALKEYRRLQEALSALDAVTQTLPGTRRPVRRAARGPSSSPGKPRTVKASGRKAKAPARRNRAGAGRSSPRAKQAIEILAERQGMTVSELASTMGIKANYLYRLLPELEQAGKISKRGRKYVARGWDKGGP